MKVTRKELYQQLWQISGKHLARRLGITVYALRRICHRLKVPIPDSRHWRLRDLGRAPTPLPLPAPTLGGETFVVIRPKYESGPNEVLARRDAIQADLYSFPRVVVPRRISRHAHPLITEAMQALENRRTDTYGIVRCPFGKHLDIRVSPEQLPRALRIFDTVLQAVLKSGQEIVKQDGKPHLRINGEHLRIRLEEKSTRIPSNGHRWNYKPSGRLQLTIMEICRGQSIWRDGKSNKLEEQLNEFLWALYPAAERQKEARLRREKHEWERQQLERVRQEEEKRRLEIEQKRKEEEFQLRILENEAERWMQSWNLRNFINAVEAQIGDVAAESREAQFLRWAREHADRIDPLTSKPKALITMWKAT